ncbi:hypothetical protein B0H34DRAFT_779062 [Crassisporium funariophilum]|nr:hypothetical protein B0H34DRAFT_779062 [Crassisporium funariophilum]
MTTTTNASARFRGSASPTSALPPLGRLASYTAEQVMSGLRNLRSLYFQKSLPSTIMNSSQLAIPKRNIRHSIHDTSVPDSGYASAEDDEGDDIPAKFAAHTESPSSTEDEDSDVEVEILRADPFERAFAIKWVTGFISRSGDWIYASESDSESEERAEILDEAIALLSSFSGNEEEEEVALTRTFSFPTAVDFKSDPAGPSIRRDIHVELNDAPLSKEDHTSVGLQSWGSSILLAERICLRPSFFSLTSTCRSGSRDKPLRILELGAGTGMLSIATAKLLRPSSNSGPGPEIIATDYHPDVLDNLSRNVATNFTSSPSPPCGLQSPIITVKALDWQNPTYIAPLDKPFDVIMAADVIYHPDHAKWIMRCVEKFLTRPSSTSPSGGVFWLMIPVRTTGRHEGMDGTVDALFADASSFDTSFKTTDEGGRLKLTVLHNEGVDKQGGIGRADEGGYRLFKIGWAT